MREDFIPLARRVGEMPAWHRRVGKEHTVSEDERVENKTEEFEAHKLEADRVEDGQVDIGRVEDA